MEDDPNDTDTHICLVCQETIVGLMEYVNHKRKGCQKKAPTSQVQQQQQGNFSVPSQAYRPAYNQGAGPPQTGVLTSSLPPTSHTTTYGLPSQADYSLTSYQPDSQYQVQGGYHPQTSTHNTVDHAYNAAVQSNSGQAESGLNVDVSTPLSNLFDSAFSPNDNSSVDPNSVLQGVGSSQNRPDFFQSLELERKGGEKPGGEPVSKNLRNKRKGLPEEFDMDLPITMILSNLEFSSDEETGVMAFPSDGSDLDVSDSEWVEPGPPKTHTGGKWKPGEGPAKRFHPHQPTGGKWKPGQMSDTKRYYRRYSTKHAKAFYCNVCKMTFADRLEFNAHNRSQDHKIAEEMERSGKSLQPPPEPVTTSSVVLDPTTGEMAEVIVSQNTHNETPQVNLIKRHKNNVAMCATCDLYFDSIKVYDIHRETKQHKDNVDKKNREIEAYMLGSTDTLQASENQDVKKPVAENNIGGVHIKTENIKTEPESHICLVCNKTFARKYEMARHLLTQFHSVRAKKHPQALEMFSKYNKYVIRLCPYQCNVCQFYFNRPSDLLDHLQSVDHMTNCQDLVGPLLCVTCKYKTASANILLEHVMSQAHKDCVALNHHVCIIRECHSKITCKYCGIQMHSAVRMRRHVEYRHSDRKMVQFQTKEAPLYPCPNCSKVMTCQYDLMKHFHRHHTGDRPYTCDVCDRSFVEQKDLTLHNDTAMHKRRALKIQQKIAAGLMKPGDKVVRPVTPKSKPIVLPDGTILKRKRGRPKKDRSQEPPKIPKKRGRKSKAELLAMKLAAENANSENAKPENEKSENEKSKKTKKPKAGKDPAGAYRPKRSIQRPKRYFSSGGSSNSGDDSDTTVIQDNDEQAVSQAIETVLEMEKKAAESGTSNKEGENGLPEIEGVDNALEDVIGAMDGNVKDENLDNPANILMEVEEAEGGADENLDELEENPDVDLDLRRSDAKKLNIFSCRYCDFSAGDINELRSHSIENHPTKISRCEPCSQTFLCSKSYKIHCAGSFHQRNVIKSGKGELYVCPHCGKKTADEQMHQLHIEFIHLHVSTEEGVNRTCQGRDSVTQLYGEHLKKLESVNYRTSIACPECGRFVMKNNMIEHLRYHTGERPYKCRHCSKAFSAPNSLRRHLLDHIGFKPMPCEECGKVFRKRSTFETHKIWHENQRKGIKFACKICGASFFADKMLSLHMKRHGERRFKCPVEGCHLAFVLKGELSEHMLTHTKEKKYLCDVCGLAGTKTRIRRHAKTHLPVKELPCEYCPYKSTCKTHLKRHMRIHIGIKPFKCLYCNYACNTHENMRKHILQTRKHQGLKIYPCRLCDFQSNVAKEFKQHLHQYHMDYVKQRASESLVTFTGLYHREEDISEPPEGSEIHQVMKGRFVKVYDGTRIGKVGEAVAPPKKKSKTVKHDNNVEALHHQPQPADLVQHQQQHQAEEMKPQVVVAADGQDNNLNKVETTSAALPPVSQHHEADVLSSAANVHVYPRGLPWTVVPPESRTDASSWVPQSQQVVDMVMPQPYHIQNLQVVRGGHPPSQAALINNSGVLTTINLDGLGSSYPSLEPGTYHVITPGADNSHSVSSVNMVTQ